MTLAADPGAKPDREALLALGQLLAEQNLRLEPQKGGPDPDFVLQLSPRGSPSGKPPAARILLPGGAGEREASVLEQVLSGMKVSAERDQGLFPDGPLDGYLCRVETGEESLRVEPEPPGPISGRGSRAGGAGDPDCPGDGLDLRLVPVRDALERNSDLEGREGEDDGEASLSSSTPDSHLGAEDSGQGEPLPEASEVSPAGRDFFLSMEPPQEEAPFNGLLFGPPWTPNGESCPGQRSCPGSPLLRPLDLAPQVGKGGVDLFPAFCSPGDLSPHPEFGEAEHHLGEEPPASPEDSPRLRAVFEALDGDGDGFVRIEEFIQFATVYGAEQVISDPGLTCL